jgi:hypothetical protein
VRQHVTSEEIECSLWQGKIVEAAGTESNSQATASNMTDRETTNVRGPILLPGSKRLSKNKITSFFKPAALMEEDMEQRRLLVEEEAAYAKISRMDRIARRDSKQRGFWAKEWLVQKLDEVVKEGTARVEEIVRNIIDDIFDYGVEMAEAKLKEKELRLRKARRKQADFWQKLKDDLTRKDYRVGLESRRSLRPLANRLVDPPKEPSRRKKRKRKGNHMGNSLWRQRRWLKEQEDGMEITPGVNEDGHGLVARLINYGNNPQGGKGRVRIFLQARRRALDQEEQMEIGCGVKDDWLGPRMSQQAGHISFKQGITDNNICPVVTADNLNYKPYRQPELLSVYMSGGTASFKGKGEGNNNIVLTPDIKNENGDTIVTVGFIDMIQMGLLDNNCVDTEEVMEVHQVEAEEVPELKDVSENSADNKSNETLPEMDTESGSGRQGDTVQVMDWETGASNMEQMEAMFDKSNTKEGLIVVDTQTDTDCRNVAVTSKNSHCNSFNCSPSDNCEASKPKLSYTKKWVRGKNGLFAWRKVRVVKPTATPANTVSSREIKKNELRIFMNMKSCNKDVPANNLPRAEKRKADYEAANNGGRAKLEKLY